MEVQAPLAEGHSIREITRQLRLARGTVRRFARHHRPRTPGQTPSRPAQHHRHHIDYRSSASTTGSPTPPTVHRDPRPRLPRQRHHPARLVAGILVCVFVSAIGLVAASTYAAWTRPGAHNGVSTLSYDLPAGNAALVPDLRAQPFVTGVAVTRALRGVVTGQPHPVPVLVAHCADLRHIFSGAQGCRDGQAYPASIDGADATNTPTVEITTGDKTIEVPVAATNLTLQSRLPSSGNAAIVVTRTAPAVGVQANVPNRVHPNERAQVHNDAQRLIPEVRHPAVDPAINFNDYRCPSRPKIVITEGDCFGARATARTAA